MHSLESSFLNLYLHASTVCKLKFNKLGCLLLTSYYHNLKRWPKSNSVKIRKWVTNHTVVKENIFKVTNFFQILRSVSFKITLLNKSIHCRQQNHSYWWKMWYQSKHITESWFNVLTNSPHNHLQNHSTRLMFELLQGKHPKNHWKKDKNIVWLKSFLIWT